MKTRSGRFGEFVMTLLLLGIGGGLIYGNAYDVEVGKKIADALAIPIVGICVGAILILSVLLRWMGGMGKKKSTFIDFKSEDGSVGISTKAICDFIERVGKEFAAVRRIDSKLIEHKGALDIALNVTVVAGNKIPELSQVLQKRIRESVRESLGLDEIRNITLKVQEIVGEPTPPEEEVD